MKHYNAKPSKFSNLGEDITGAARHRNDTYESHEVAREKAFRKKSKSNVKELLNEYKTKFTQAMHESTEAGRAVLLEYEFKKTMLSCELLTDSKITSKEELRALVLATENREQREVLRKAFNALNRKLHKIKYRIRPIELSKYFEPKTREAFTEFNGVKTEWNTSNESFDSKRLSELVKAVQFGNSIPDSERVYCGENLIKSIDLLKKHFNFDFKSIGFAFGARGKAGSIAHYQDSAKVLQFNRHWDGALIHELGHAIDYALGLPSHNLPYEIRSKYREKIRGKVTNTSYYMKNVEIFARLFEAFCEKHIPELTPFMFVAFDRTTLPELDQESEDWMCNALESILIRKESKS